MNKIKTNKDLLPIQKYNNLKELYNILNSGKISGEEFLSRTEEFLIIYENYKENNEFKQFYIDLKNAYLDKMKKIEHSFKFSKQISDILNNPINNPNYNPKIKTQN